MKIILIIFCALHFLHFLKMFFWGWVNMNFHEKYHAYSSAKNIMREATKNGGRHKSLDQILKKTKPTRPPSKKQNSPILGHFEMEIQKIY